MEFSSNQEDIYNKLVNSSTRYGKETQVKYELTRPRKKQKKKNESRLEIVNEQFRADEKVKEDIIYDTAMDSDSSDEDDLKDREPPRPPPRSDSLQPQPVSHVREASPSPSTDTQSTNTELENIYEPRHWKQQIYESWTPHYFPPPPSQPPPKPPLSNVSNKKEESSNKDSLQGPVSPKADARQKRQQNYEAWIPSSAPSVTPELKPPSEAPPPVPGGHKSAPAECEEENRKEMSKSKLLSNPKQLKGVKRVGQQTPAQTPVTQQQLLMPVRPAPKPPVAPINCELAPAETESEIRLSPIKDSLPDTENDNDNDRLYEPCNWRRVVKTQCEEEMYGTIEDILPPPPSPPPLGGSLTFARAPLRKSKSILKEKKSGDDKKTEKRVRMLFPEDTVTPI